jgi:hypothetical protein
MASFVTVTGSSVATISAGGASKVFLRNEGPDQEARVIVRNGEGGAVGTHSEVGVLGAVTVELEEPEGPSARVRVDTAVTSSADPGLGS